MAYQTSVVQHLEPGWADSVDIRAYLRFCQRVSASSSVAANSNRLLPCFFTMACTVFEVSLTAGSSPCILKKSVSCTGYGCSTRPAIFMAFMTVVGGGERPYQWEGLGPHGDHRVVPRILKEISARRTIPYAPNVRICGP